MDRENALAPGWSHVLSDTNNLAELEAFRIAVGAPRQAFHLKGRRPHLDLKLEPRDRALQMPGVMVFERTSDLLRYMGTRRGAREGADGRGTDKAREGAEGRGKARNS